MVFYLTGPKRRVSPTCVGNKRWMTGRIPAGTSFTTAFTWLASKKCPTARCKLLAWRRRGEFLRTFVRIGGSWSLPKGAIAPLGPSQAVVFLSEDPKTHLNKRGKEEKHAV